MKVVGSRGSNLRLAVNLKMLDASLNSALSSSINTEQQLIYTYSTVKRESYVIQLSLIILYFYFI